MSLFKTKFFYIVVVGVAPLMVLADKKHPTIQGAKQPYTVQWRSGLSRRAHYSENAGSNPACATTIQKGVHVL